MKSLLLKIALPLIAISFSTVDADAGNNHRGIYSPNSATAKAKAGFNSRRVTQEKHAIIAGRILKKNVAVKGGRRSN